MSDQKGFGIGALLRAYSGQAPLFLAERTVRRTARYYRDLAKLTRQASAEPRLWIGCLEGFWSGLAEDYGDYLRIVSGHDMAGELATGANGPKITRLVIPERTNHTGTTFEIPATLFDDSIAEVALSTTGFFRGTSRVLHPGVHLHLDPPIVARTDKHCTLRLSDLPTDLLSGMSFVGTVLAVPRRRTTGPNGEPILASLPTALAAIIQIEVR